MTQLPAKTRPWRKARAVSKRPDKPLAAPPAPANDNESGGNSAGHTPATVTGSSESRVMLHPSVVALAAILGRQAARQWMKEASNATANDNDPAPTTEEKTDKKEERKE